MSDNPPSYPPPPPANVPPPPPSQPGYGLPPSYQGAAPPDYSQQYQQQAYQGPMQQPYNNPAVVATGGAGALLYQLGGPAAWSIGFGLVSIVVPFATNYYFPILPIAGLLSAVRAIQRGRVIGGVIGIAVNAIGGLVSLFASGVIGG